MGTTYAKRVLEHPPVLSTIVNILNERYLYKEACNLKLVLKSDVTNEIVDRSLADKRYAHDYKCAMQRRIKRFVQVLQRHKNLITTAHKRRLRIKYLFVSFGYLIDNKDIVDLPAFSGLKKTINDGLTELSTDPEIYERIKNVKFYLH